MPSRVRLEDRIRSILAPISAFDRLPQETDLKKEVTWKEKESFEHKEKWSDSWEGETATCSVYAA